MGSVSCACRLAKQVNLFYAEVLRFLSQPPLNAHFDKSWTAHVSVKAMLYDAEAWIQQGTYHGKETEANIQLACLKVRLSNPARPNIEWTHTLFVYEKGEKTFTKRKKLAHRCLPSHFSHRKPLYVLDSVP